MLFLPLKLLRSTFPAQGPWCKNEMAIFLSQAAFSISHSLPYWKVQIIVNFRIIGLFFSTFWQHFLLWYRSHVVNCQEGLQICPARHKLLVSTACFLPAKTKSTVLSKSITFNFTTIVNLQFFDFTYKFSMKHRKYSVIHVCTYLVNRNTIAC